jgi:HAD superfamily hydrolase (TIGR01459 family)
MTFSKILSLSEIAHHYDLIMFDLWGVFVEGNRLYEGTAEAANKLMQKHDVVFVTNSPRLKGTVAQRMRDFGLNCADEQMFSSGQFAKDLLDSNKIINNPKLYHLSTGNYPSAAEYGHNITTKIQDANVLLLTCQLEEGDDLNQFNHLLQEAADLNILAVCSNPDTIIPNLGRLRYCPGFFANIYKAMGGRVVYTGKPGKDLFIQAIESRGVKDHSRALMIGDTLETDILGANLLGIPSGLVTTGNIHQAVQGCKAEADILKAIEHFCTERGIIPSLVVDITK